MKNTKTILVPIILLILCYANARANVNVIRIGLNYPQTGPYSVQGQAQFNAAQLAVEEIRVNQLQ